MRVELTRDDSQRPNPVIVDVFTYGGDGNLVNTEMGGFEIFPPGAGAITSEYRGTGHQRYVVTPTSDNTRIRLFIDATVAGTTMREDRTAILLPTIAPEWEQPEAVPGLVNTSGYEDGPEVSPDGNWLIVSTYSFVNAFCCLTGCGLPVRFDSAACQSSVGPYAGPERPGMFGADRVRSPTSLRNTCPKLCLEGPGGADIADFPLVPVAAYGFHRQPDGSFAEPFIIGFDADGCGGPFGYSFTDVTGSSGNAVFTFDHFTGAKDLWFTPLALGQRNILGSYACVNGAYVENGLVPTHLSVNGPTATHGNPSIRGGHLFYDDEYTSNPHRIFHASVAGALPGATISSAAEFAAVPSTDNAIQPHLDGNQLYFMKDLAIVSSSFNGDPAQAASWTTLRTELACDVTATGEGQIVALGEPSIAVPGTGPRELYFVFAFRQGSQFQFDVGRVKRRV